jgi:hypothetical protein
MKIFVFAFSRKLFAKTYLNYQMLTVLVKKRQTCNQHVKLKDHL